MAEGERLELQCQCCRMEKSFVDGEEAFQHGWDAPPHFFGYVACNLCPGSFVVMGVTKVHLKAHERWLYDGRPGSFDDSLKHGDVPALSNIH